jgi:dipeptidyl aminopeptidase/acylaminoacyl peptidase
MLLLAAALLDAAACPATVRELRVPTPAGHVLAARLALPAGRSRAPVVVMVSGAGPQDRDYSTVASTQFANHFFAVLEERLRCAGVGAVRFDEVGTGHSTGSYAAYATTRTLANDVLTLLDTIRAAPGVDSARVAVLGHSEGGAIAGIVGAERPTVAAVLLLGAPVERGADIMRFQIAQEARHSPAAGDTARREHARRSAQDRWYQFFLAFAPAPFYARLRQPLLILHGEYDELVPAQQADAILQLARAHGNAWTYCRRYPEHGHGFYGNVPRIAAAAPEVLDDIVRFARWALIAGQPPALRTGPCRREGAGPFRRLSAPAAQASAAR